MQIHELNNFTGTLGSGAYLAVDDGNDTGKLSTQQLLAATEARIDNIIAGPAPSAEEIVDARRGADGVTYNSLGTAIRSQVTDLKSEINEFVIEREISSPYWEQGYINPTNGEHLSDPTGICLKRDIFIENAISITAKTGYKFRLAAYQFDGTYVGSWNGTSFTQDWGWAALDSISLKAFSSYKFAVTIIKAEGTSLNVEDYDKIIVSYYGTSDIYMNSPDAYEGTDSEKLQKCFDALANVGGNIVINREYKLTEDLIINNDSDNQKFIHVIGIGQNAKINCGSYRITTLPSGHSYGGVLWNNVTFVGDDVCFDAGLLIRLFFTQCSFNGFVTVFNADQSEWQTDEPTRYIQTLYLNQCTLKGIGTGFYISGSGAYDLSICDCLIENATYAVRAIEGSLMSVRISNCVIEAIWTAGIYIGCNCSSAVISNNYFEAVPQTIYIVANKANANLSILNNYLVTTYDSAILIEPNTTIKKNLTAVVENNTFFAINNPSDSERIIGTNLFGGLYMANRIKAVAPDSSVDTTNKIVRFHASFVNSKIFTDFSFKENTQYTLILYGKNDYNHETNVGVAYTDGTSSSNTIKFTSEGVDSYAVYTSESGKTISYIGGFWSDGWTTLSYDRCGVFEGVIDETEFEPYAKAMISFVSAPSVAQAISLKNNYAIRHLQNDNGYVVSNYQTVDDADLLTTDGVYAYNDGVLIVNSTTNGVLQRIYSSSGSSWRFKAINGTWSNWNS